MFQLLNTVVGENFEYKNLHLLNFLCKKFFRHHYLSEKCLRENLKCVRFIGASKNAMVPCSECDNGRVRKMLPCLSRHIYQEVWTAEVGKELVCDKATFLAPVFGTLCHRHD